MYKRLGVGALYCLFSMCGCAAPYLVEHNPDALNQALNELEHTGRYEVRASFHSTVGQDQQYVKGIPPRMNAFKLQYRKSELLNNAGEASINRWFSPVNTLAEVERVSITAAIKRLRHTMRIDTGYITPNIELELAFKAEFNGQVISEGLYPSQASGDRLFMPSDEATANNYCYAIYKALFASFDVAIKETAERLENENNIKGAEIK